MSVSVSYVGSEGHFISASKAIGARNNELPESLAALAGYNVSGSTATPCFTAPPAPRRCWPRRQPRPILACAGTAGLHAAQSLQRSRCHATIPATRCTSTTTFPQFSGVSDTTSFVGNENWNAVELSIRQRPSHGLNFMVNYTYSKSIDDLGTFRVGDNDSPRSLLSTADKPQNLVATVVYLLPVGRGHMWGDNWASRAVASDWTAPESSLITPVFRSC